MARRFIAWTFRSAATVIALSEQWQENVRRICRTARVVVLANAVSLPDLGRRQVPHARIEVLFLGRLGQRKGTFDLVEAFSKVAPRHPQARLICAGDGAIAEIQARGRALGIEDRLECPGWLGEAAAAARLASASVFALPSYAEGMPMALLEAMSWGLPVVTSPVGGIPQLVKHDVNGKLIPAGDVDALAGALLQLIEEPQERNRLGLAARATIERDYSLAASIEGLIELYARFGVGRRTSADARTP